MRAERVLSVAIGPDEKCKRVGAGTRRPGREYAGSEAFEGSAAAGPITK